MRVKFAWAVEGGRCTHTLFYYIYSGRTKYRVAAINPEFLKYFFKITQHS
jgi:hypothetical protein